MARVYLSLGSNEGGRGENIKEALVNLERWGIKIIKSSKLYETEPVGNKDQPWFYNMVACADTKLSPEEVLKAISAIELAMGRQRTRRDGPRKIDIDILFYDDLVLDMEGLKIPHPRIQDRNFVLLPMEEIAAELVHPVLKKTVGEILKECNDRAIVRPIV